MSLLGYEGKIEWTQTADALVVKLPAQKVSEFTVGLKITGTDLKPVAGAEVAETIRPDAKGKLALLADGAELHGDGIKTENQGGQPSIGFWDNGKDWVSWKVQFAKAGTFKVSAAIAATTGGTEFVVEVAGQKLAGDGRVGQVRERRPGHRRDQTGRRPDGEPPPEGPRGVEADQPAVGDASGKGRLIAAVRKFSA